MATTFKVEFGGNRKASVSPMTVIYYDEEFSTATKDADLIEDFMKLAIAMEKTGAVNALKFMRILWACEKTYAGGAFANFQAWIKMLPNAPLNNVEDYSELAGAIQNEFFPEQRTNPSTEETPKNEVID